MKIAGATAAAVVCAVLVFGGSALITNMSGAEPLQDRHPTTESTSTSDSEVEPRIPAGYTTDDCSGDANAPGANIVICFVVPISDQAEPPPGS